MGIDGKVRSRHRALVLQALEASMSLSRAEIVDETGLSKTTILAIVSDLLAERIVAEVQAPADGARGRPAKLLALQRGAGVGVGIDIGNEFINLMACDRSGSVLARRTRRIPIEQRAGATADMVAATVRDLLRPMALDAASCDGIVVSVPEPLDSRGDIARARVATRWVGTNPRSVISRALRADVRVDNDANLAAIGEALFGTARRIRDVLYVKASHGIGMGIILDGRLIHGSAGLAGEIGHTKVRPDGVVCTCGNRGCLFTLVSAEYLASQLATATGDSRLGAVGLARLGRADHLGAGAVLEDAGRDVGTSVAALCNALNPSLVVVGGLLSVGGDWLFDGLRESIARSGEPQVLSALAVRHSALNGQAEVLGAVGTAVGLDRVAAAPSR